MTRAHYDEAIRIMASADRPRKHLTRAACLAALLLATAVASAADDPSARLKQSADELNRVRSRIADITQQLAQDQDRQDELRAAVEQAERKLAAASAQVRKLTAAIDQQDVKVRAAQTERGVAERRLEEQRVALAGQLRAAYMLGTGGGRAELLLSQDDPGRLTRMLAYFDYFNRARQARIDGISREVEQAQTLARQHQNELAALRALQDSRKQALAQLAADRAERQRAAQRLQSRIAGEAEELEQLTANEKQLRTLLESLKRALADLPALSGDQKPFPEMRGRLAWPLRGRILASYGEAKAGGKLQWKGLWIGGNEGSPVRASARGRVAYVGWLSSYGLIVVLEHEKGYFTLYGHNAAVSRAAGDTVGPGEVIATVGNTGGYEEPGLYFEVRKGTEPLDPQDWLAR